MTAAAIVMRLGVVALAILAFARPALSHDSWLDGHAVDRKTQALCCGEGRDCFQISPDKVHIRSDGRYHFDDTDLTIDVSRAMPSPDGAYWRCIWGGEIKCLFVPFDGT